MANEFVVRNGLISLGGVTVPITGVTGTYTVSENDFTVEALSGSFTITLLNAGLYKGKLYDIKNSGVGNITAGHLTVNGDGLITGNLVVQGTTTSQNSNVITTNDLTITVGNNQTSGTLLNGAGLLVGSSNIATWRYNNLTTSWQSNIGITNSYESTFFLKDA